MSSLTCAEARDLASDLLDGELTPELAHLVQEHVRGCPTCPNLYRAMVAVYQRMKELRLADGATDRDLSR